MKKLLFVLAFAFIGQQAFSQIYIIAYNTANHQNSSGGLHPSNCYPDNVLTKIDPTGNVTYTCVSSYPDQTSSSAALITISQELNGIINQGYKLIHTNYNEPGLQLSINGTVWYFAIP